MSQTDADRDLLPENYAELNERFYEAEPWRYFQQRLAHLVHAASDTDSYRALFADGISVGSLTLGFAPEQSPSSSRATPEQSFVAIETEVLLHHVAETLLRVRACPHRPG
jgi:hypothetical protein